MTKILFILFAPVFLLFALPTDTSELDRLTAVEAPGKLSFIGNAGDDQEFLVENWAFTKLEQLDNPTAIQVEAVLDLRSISCGWKDLEDGVKNKKDYFFIKKFPEAKISINGAEKMDDGSYHADAMLTLKGISKSVPLNFTLSESAPYQVKASGTIIRQEFKFKGDGPKNEVPFMVEATLELAN